MVTTVDTVTTTVSARGGYANTRRYTDRCQNGVLWQMHIASGGGSTTTGFEFWYSTDNGASFTEDAAGRFGYIGTGTSFASSYIGGSFFIDLDDFAHVVYKDVSDGFIRYRRGTPNAGRTAWTWSASVQVHNFGPVAWPDIVAFRTPGTSPTQWDVFITAVQGSDGSNTRVQVERLHIANNGTVTADNWDGLGDSGGMGILQALSGTDPSHLCVDFNHTGDGKTVAGGTPHIYSAWSVNNFTVGIQFRKATYSAGAWTWGSNVNIDTTRVANDWIQMVFDGTRVVIAGLTVTAGFTAELMMWERDVADTTTTTRVLVTSPSAATNLASGSITYDALGNVYFVGINQDEADGSRDLVTRKWTRATTTLESESAAVDATVLNHAHPSMKRGWSNRYIEFSWIDGASSPYTLMYGNIYLGTKPAVALLTPADSGKGDGTFTWDYTDTETDAETHIRIARKKVVT